MSPNPFPALLLPLFEIPPAQAGFPSPATDYLEEALDLNELLVRNPPATFYVRVKGASMIDVGLLDNDIAIVDRSITPKPGCIVVAACDGSIYIKRLRALTGRLALCSQNEARATAYPPLFLDQMQEHVLWGVVTGAVRKF